MTRSRIIEWDGQHLPDELHTLPPGRYLLEALDDGEPLTADEEAGIVEALTALDAGQGLSLTEVIREIRAHRPR
jgi:hypothetical protein